MSSATLSGQCVVCSAGALPGLRPKAGQTPFVLKTHAETVAQESLLTRSERRVALSWLWSQGQLFGPAGRATIAGGSANADMGFSWVYRTQ